MFRRVLITLGQNLYYSLVILVMSGKNLSGEQSRKRKKNAGQVAKKSSEFFKTFFKKAKSDESESEDDDQLVVPATNKTVKQPQGDTSYTRGIVQKSVG